MHLHFSLQSSLESLTKKNIAMEQDLLATREDCNGTMNKLQKVESKYLQLQQNIQRCVHVYGYFSFIFYILNFIYSYWTLALLMLKCHKTLVDGLIDLEEDGKDGRCLSIYVVFYIPWFCPFQYNSSPLCSGGGVTGCNCASLCVLTF